MEPGLPSFLLHALETLAEIVNGVGYLILAITVLKFVGQYVVFEASRLRGLACVERFRTLRLELGSHIILAIDFMVISDVIHSGLLQTRDRLIDLGLFILIRSALAFFIGLDMREIREERSGASDAPPKPPGHSFH